MSAARSTARAWDWEGEAIGVRGVDTIEQAHAAILHDLAHDERQRAEDFLDGMALTVYSVPAAYWRTDRDEQTWDMAHVYVLDDVAARPGRGRVKVLWWSEATVRTFVR